MEPEGSLPHSQRPSICSYSEQNQSSPLAPHPTSCIAILILSFHVMPGSSKWSLSLRFPYQILYRPILSPMRAFFKGILVLIEKLCKIKKSALQGAEDVNKTGS